MKGSQHCQGKGDVQKKAQHSKPLEAALPQPDQATLHQEENEETNSRGSNQLVKPVQAVRIPEDPLWQVE
jgi:hypothetical protein